MFDYVFHLVNNAPEMPRSHKPREPPPLNLLKRCKSCADILIFFSFFFGWFPL